MSRWTSPKDYSINWIASLLTFVAEELREWGQAPTSIEYPQEQPGGTWVHHVYKDVRATPVEALRRLGMEKPADGVQASEALRGRDGAQAVLEAHLWHPPRRRTGDHPGSKHLAWA